MEVAATSICNAAPLVCGVDVGDSRLTAGIRTKPSNSGTGGAFYSFSQMFVKITKDTQQPSWTQGKDSTFGEFWNVYAANSPFDLHFVECDQEDINAAQRDLEKVMSGEDLGDGGSSSGGADGYYFYSGNHPRACREQSAKNSRMSRAGIIPACAGNRRQDHTGERDLRWSAIAAHRHEHGYAPGARDGNHRDSRLRGRRYLDRVPQAACPLRGVRRQGVELVPRRGNGLGVRSRGW